LNRLYKFGKAVTRIVMTVMGGYEVIHKERLNNAEGLIFASNHISNFDPPFIGTVIPYDIYFFAKAELFKGRLFNWLFHRLNAIPVKRNTTDFSAITAVMNIIETGKTILLFPEGTTKKKKSIKPGVGMFAMKTKKGILPLYIGNSDNLFSCLFSRKKKIRIIFGNPIDYNYFHDWELTKDNYQKLADYTYSKIMELKNENISC